MSAGDAPKNQIARPIPTQWEAARDPDGPPQFGRRPPQQGPRPDADGYYLVENVALGYNNAPRSQTFTAGAPGHYNRSGSVVVACDEVSSLDFALLPVLPDASIVGRVVEGVAGEPPEPASRVHLEGHIGDLVLQGLELSDRLTDLNHI